MAVKFAVLLPFLILFQFVLADYKSYSGYKVYEIFPKTRNAQSRLRSMSISTEAYDFWTMPKEIGKKSVVMVPPEYQKKFEKSLRKLNISYAIAVKDLAPLVKRDHILQTSSMKTTIQNIQFKRYFRYNFILRYMDGLAKKYPDLVTIKTIGDSYEKRKIKAIHISNKNSNGPKSTILIDAGIHGREWIGPATALYIIDQLVVHSKQNMINSLDWVIVPVANPDSYEYTHTRERFWLKNRKPTKWCVGSDINRNFDFHWGEETGTSNPCSEKFRGQKAFSEPETVALKSLMQSLNGTCKFYLSLRSFGQSLLYPWSHEDSQPDNWKDMDEVAQEGASAIRSASGTQYVVGSFSKILYKASGGSNDYALGTQNIPVSITMTLPSGGREGLRGFHPQPNKIVSIASESWIGIKAMAMIVVKKFDSVNTTGADASMDKPGGDASMNTTGDGSTVGNATVNANSTIVSPPGGSEPTVADANGNGTIVNPTVDGNSTVVNANGDGTTVNSTAHDNSTLINKSEGNTGTGTATSISPTGGGDSTKVDKTRDSDSEAINGKQELGSTKDDHTRRDDSTFVDTTGANNSTVDASIGLDSEKVNATEGGDSTRPTGDGDSASPTGDGNSTGPANANDANSAKVDNTRDSDSEAINEKQEVGSTKDDLTRGDDSTVVDTIGANNSTVDATEGVDSTNPTGDGNSTGPTNGRNSAKVVKTGDGDSEAVNAKRELGSTKDDLTRGDDSTVVDTTGANNSTVDASSGFGSEKVNATKGGDSTVLNLTETNVP